MFTINASTRAVFFTLRKNLSTVAAVSNLPQLTVKARDPKQMGSRKSRELRESSGLIPGVVYGVDEDRNVVKISVVTPVKELVKEMRVKGRSFENTLYEIIFEDGSKHVVTPRQLQLHPLTLSPIAINFLKYWPGNTMRIPFNFNNMDANIDIKRGSFMVYINSFVECICDGEVPSTIDIDVSNVKNGDIVRLSSLSLPPGVRPTPTVSSDYVICVLKSGSL